ncbi:hypothetical protein DV515_00019664 [Chloebia gouldiae]|uniref:Uncharacterized protein n=1 Tax=Chloebia gouldiae TaxID=44316 RepID=A0A3L8Q4K1_CHLGU|nr:hypothetical protein DV515_00019664 [Chloebia gouldiae]
MLEESPIFWGVPQYFGGHLCVEVWDGHQVYPLTSMGGAILGVSDGFLGVPEGFLGFSGVWGCLKVSPKGAGGVPNILGGLQYFGGHLCVEVFGGITLGCWGGPQYFGVPPIFWGSPLCGGVGPTPGLPIDL